jgi:AcrR family transcriptional regulator
MRTGPRLVAAAAALLDAGGEPAVTLRAVAAATGVSHNAPYKHFANRDALLAAVATEDFGMLGEIFTTARSSPQQPADRLREAIDGVIRFSHQHPGRYRLLLSNPIVAAQEGELKVAAHTAFHAFTTLVQDCQAAGTLPEAPSGPFSSLIFATLHGLIDADASGRLEGEKGLGDVSASMNLLLKLLFQGRTA